MSLPPDLKPLYASWLEAEAEKVATKNDKLASVYGKALENLKLETDPLVHPNELLRVKGIGNRIKNVLKAKLVAYCKETGFEFPSDPTLQVENTNNRQKTKLRSLEDDVTDREVSKKKRRYVPKRRSGAYAILLGLLENSSQRGGSSKNEIVALAHKYCDLTFHSNPTTRDFHSGWSAIKTLLSRELVVEEGRPKKYLLTEEGEEMAHILKRTDQITFQDEDGYQRKYNTTAKESTNCGLESEFDDSVNYSELMETVAYSKNSNSYSQVLDQKNLPSFSKARKIHSLGPSGSATATGPVPRNQSPLKGSEDGIVRARWNATSYELWNPDTYDIVLVIDHREVKSKREREFFADQLRERDVIVEVRSLSLSDMLWVARHKITKRECILNFMLERKRLDDFAMSIMDNRFVEQKNRLKKTGCRNIYYLVEDSTSDIAIRMADAIKTAVWVTVVYNNFYVKRTKNSDDTVSWLHSLTEVIKSHYCNTSLLVLSPRNLKSQDDYLLRLQEFRDQFERDASLIECCHTFDCFQEIMEKKSLMTVKELYLKTLMVNKGVSLEKAVSIQAKFPTLKVLLEAYRGCKTEEEAKSLIANALKDEPGTRKVGKALSETLWKTFGVH